MDTKTTIQPAAITGVSLTPQSDGTAQLVVTFGQPNPSATTFNWLQLLQLIAQLLPEIIALFTGVPHVPTPAPAPTVKA
jgi:hypothetical protein